MLDTLYTYGIALTTFLVVDMFWLNIAAKDLYKRSIGQFLAANPNLGAAGIFYAAYIATLVYFVINPARQNNDFPQALLRAAIFGGICYATYDLTNLAVLKDWPLSLSIIDIIWGMVITMAVTAITLILLQRLGIK